MRNNRIGANEFLNQCCAFTPDLESILRARMRKIVLQHNPPDNGHKPDVVPILLQKSLMVSGKGDSVAVMRFAVEAGPVSLQCNLGNS